MDPLARVHLNGLRAVEAVARCGSLAKAAAFLGVSPGAVSQQVIRAERQLGRAIFRRTPHGLVPTAYGETLLPPLARAFRLLTAAVDSAGPQRAEALTVSVAPVLASRWLVPRLAGFTGTRPGLSLRIDATPDFADLDADGIDVAIRIGGGSWPGVRAEKLMDQVVFPICSPALARGLSRPRDIAGLPIIRDHGSPHLWPLWLAAVGLEPAVLGPGPVYSDASLCLDAAVSGQGLMLAWPALAHGALATGAVVAPFPAGVATGQSYWFAHSRHRRLRPLEAAFRDWLRREMQATLGPGGTGLAPVRPT